MSAIRTKFVVTVAALLTVSLLGIISQHRRIGQLKERLRQRAGEHSELSTNYTNLLATIDTRDAEIDRLRSGSTEVLRLRNQLTAIQTQLASAVTNGQPESYAQPDTSDTYISRQEVTFAGYGSPENSFQSWMWAEMYADYSNWFDSLSPKIQDEEVANPRSREDFRIASNSGLKWSGAEVLAEKAIATDRVELKVRIYMESTAGRTVSVLIFPMVAVGNEWKLGDEIRSYSSDWDHSAQ